jgi:hypothetical protein
LYLRAALGGGGVRDGLSSTFLLGFDGEATGASGVGGLSIGGAIKPGFILGGGLYFEQVADPKVKINGVDVSTDVSVGTFGLIGPMIEWYPNAQKGFHLGGAIGGARIQMKDSSGRTKNNEPVGGGGLFEIGYDWWVSDDWSLGVMGRLTGATMRDSEAQVRHNWSGGAVLFTATYN